MFIINLRRLVLVVLIVVGVIVYLKGFEKVHDSVPAGLEYVRHGK